MKTFVLGALAVLGSASLPCSAGAAVLTGQSVSSEYRLPNLATPYAPTTYNPQSFVVGAGQESAITIENVTTFNVDFADLALDIAFDTSLSNPRLNSASFNGLVFTSTGFGQITGVAISSSSNLAGFDLSRVSIVGNELQLDFNDLSYDTDTVVGLTFTGGAVPEPAAWALMIAGVGLIGGGLRRRRAQLRHGVSFA